MVNPTKYKERFKTLCPYLELNTNQFDFERAKEYIEYRPRTKVWEKLSFYQNEKQLFERTELSDLLCHCWDAVLKQPFWYLDLKDNNTKPFLSAEIELQLDRLKERIVYEYPDLILNLFETNEEDTKQLLRKVILH